MKTIPDMSIVVSNYNSSDFLNDALASVIATAGDLAVDVTVIDDASTDGGLARVDDKFKNDLRFSFVQNKKNVGISALNIILDRSQAKYILTLDADARLRQGSLQALIAFMEATPRAGAATANLVYPNGALQNYYRRIMTPSLYFFTTLIGRFIDKYFLGLRYFKYYRYLDIDVTQNPELEQPPIACLILRREAIDGYIIDPETHVVAVEIDLCRRLYDSGYKIYLVSNALVTHIKSASFAKRESVWQRNEYYHTFSIYFRKHYPIWFPALWILMWCDRFLRSIMVRILDREILK